MKNRKPVQNLKKKLHLPKKEVVKQIRPNETLIASQTIQNAILEKSLVGYYIVIEGVFHFANPTVISYTGYLPEEMIGQKRGFSDSSG